MAMPIDTGSGTGADDAGGGIHVELAGCICCGGMAGGIHVELADCICCSGMAGTGGMKGTLWRHCVMRLLLSPKPNTSFASLAPNTCTRKPFQSFSRPTRQSFATSARIIRTSSTAGIYGHGHAHNLPSADGIRIQRTSHATADTGTTNVASNRILGARDV